MSKLILNADDFGMSPLFNKAILELIEEGSLRSTSVMVNRLNISVKDDIELLKKYREGGKCSIGLHFEFVGGNKDKEIERQIQHYKFFFGGLPDHIDVHKFDYDTWYFDAIRKFQGKIAYRNTGDISFEGKSTTYKCISATENSMESIFEYINGIGNNESGELWIHPGYHDPYILSSLGYKREEDIKKCKLIAHYCKENGVELCRWNDLLTKK